MSLSTPTPVRKFALGIVCSRSFDRPTVLHDLLGDKLDRVSHIYSIGALPGGRVVEDFAREHGIDFTVYPSTQHTFRAVSRVIEASEFVYILSDGESKMAAFAKTECEKRAALEQAEVEANQRDKGTAFRFKEVAYDAVTLWRERVGQVAEVLAAIPKEEIEASEALKAIARVVK